ncbi:MAG: DNA repair protein RadC [Verrucomicrobium sp.]|nr:DNA repair protein RadC [Verrucomicrobium sp.]
MMSAAQRIREMPDEERPRERLLKHGAAALKTSELIAILLRTGREGASALQIGEEILHRFGGLESLGRASVADLSKIKGVGPAKALQLVAAFGLGARFSQTEAAAQPIETPQQVQALLGDEMRLLPHESIRVILLNAKRRLIAVEEISRGLLDESLFHPREGLRAAVARNAHSLIMAHNHPSGDPRPSVADRQVTRIFAEAAALMQIPLLDHVILGAASYFSFKEHGLL